MAAAREVVTAQDVQAVAPGGELRASAGALVTPWARELAATRGVRLTLGPRPEAGLAALGADHGGLALKEALKPHLTRLGWRFLDLGTHTTEPVDYPDIAAAVARRVASGEARFGILVDGAGIGSAMAANKVPGVRAALCVDLAAARNAREHNDANVMTLGARLPEAILGELLEAFLSLQCTEERHLRRVRKLMALEKATGQDRGGLA